MKRFTLFAVLALSAIASSAQTSNLTGTVEGQSTANAANLGNNQQFNPSINFSTTDSPFSAGMVRYDYGTQRIVTVPNVIAPGITASPSTCLGSKSGGGSVLGFGASGGSTVQDDPCNGREAFKLYMLAGMADIALARLCQLPEERKAITQGNKLTRAKNDALLAKALRDRKPGDTAEPVITVTQVRDCPPTDEEEQRRAQEAMRASAALNGTTTGGPSTADPYIAARMGNGYANR